MVFATRMLPHVRCQHFTYACIYVHDGVYTRVHVWSGAKLLSGVGGWVMLGAVLMWEWGGTIGLK